MPSRDGRPVGGRNPIHEMYGVIPWGGTPSMELPPIHGGWESMGGMQHIPLVAIVGDLPNCIPGQKMLNQHQISIGPKISNLAIQTRRTRTSAMTWRIALYPHRYEKYA